MKTTASNVATVRSWFQDLYKRREFITDKSGCQMLEVLGATFLADEEVIFGEINQDYAQREIEWYKSRSLNVNDIPGGPPKIWKECADSAGLINSNYGWMIWDEANYFQYEHAKIELQVNPESRRAVMIYTRPSIWGQFNSNGMSDFICTNCVQYFIRDAKLIALVQMRSNDVIFGFKNDRVWQRHVHQKLAEDLKCEVGDMIWHVGSLHIYSRHFSLIEDNKIPT